MKTQKETGEETDLEEASSKLQGMKKTSSAKEEAPANAKNLKDIDLTAVKKIIVACDAGMGSSAMGASLLAKKVKSAGLSISVTNCAINDLPGDVDIVVTHKDLTTRARNHARNAVHLSLTNFLDNTMYNNLVEEIVSASTPEVAPEVAEVVADDAQDKPVFQLAEKNIFLGLTADNKLDAIRFAGEQLVKLGYAKAEYVDGMFDREKLVSTYLGESIAVPHGTIVAKDKVMETGIVICQYRDGLQWGDDEDDVAKLVIGIAPKNDEHIAVISTITNALDDESSIETLIKSNDVNEILNILKA
ncbi:PTS sugar transporter subunit IIA [Psychromonas sp. KJ10-10]|uniref:PTS sugar transporter subunit IIA n=1 Tax=Psychromonas sp. KJ10-10 TaxID=3391823 RepID=UPI0039B6E3D0